MGRSRTTRCGGACSAASAAPWHQQSLCFRGGSQLSDETSEGSDQAALRHLLAGLGLQPGRARAVFGRIHRRIELGLIIDEGDEGRGDDDGLPPLEEVVDAAHKATKVAELLRFNTSSFPSLARSRSP